MSTLTSTNGWDTVYAIFFPDMNKAIVHQKTSPTSFTQTIKSDDGTFTLSGNFSDWQLTNGGDGKNVFLTVPIPNSSLVQPSSTITCSPITMVISVDLLWVSEGGSNTNTNQLKVDSSLGTPNTVTIQMDDINWGTNPNDPISQGIYTEVMQNWFEGNIGVFQHIFSTVDLNLILSGDNTGFQWVVPTGNPMYAVVDQENSIGSDQSIFAVLCMTENRPSPGTHEIDPFAIPDGVNSAFLISPERILSQMILPGMPIMFKDNPPLSSFSISADGITLVNNVELEFSVQTLDNGDTIHPKIDANNFSIQMQNNQVEMTMNGLHFEWSPGITVEIDHVSTVSLIVNTNRQFKMDVVGTPTNAAQVVTSGWVIKLEIVASIAAAILGAAAGGFLGGLASGGAATVTEGGTEGTVSTISTTVTQSAQDASSNLTTDAFEGALESTSGNSSRFSTFFAANWAKMLGGFVGSAIGGSTGAIPTIIENLAKNKGSEIPTLDAFGTQVMAPITWPDMESNGFILVNGALNGPLQIGININYDHGQA